MCYFVCKSLKNAENLIFYFQKKLDFAIKTDMKNKYLNYKLKKRFGRMTKITSKKFDETA